MTFHNSPIMERFCMRAHAFWAFACFVQGTFSLGAAYIFFPWAFGNPYAFFFTCLVYSSLATFILGMGGFLFHIWGARDHRENLRKLEKSDAR